MVIHPHLNSISFLAELLHQELQNADCIVLPGLGAFIGNSVSASYHPVTHSFMPPGKRIMFNRRLIHDDGFLAGRLAALRNIPYEQARLAVIELVRVLEHMLDSGQKVRFDLLGTLFLDIEGVLQFEQEPAFNYLPNSFGLYSFQAKPIQRLPKIPVVSLPEKENEELEKKSRVIPFKPYWLTVPAAAAAIFAVLQFNILPFNSISEFNLNPFIPKSSISSNGLKVNGIQHNRIKREAKFDAEISATGFNVNSARFFIVSGCFSTEANALGSVESLAEMGFDAFILDKNHSGLFRVVYGQYNSISDAQNELSEIRKGLNEEAWLLIH
jgi:hypothetical protein